MAVAGRVRVQPLIADMVIEVATAIGAETMVDVRVVTAIVVVPAVAIMADSAVRWALDVVPVVRVVLVGNAEKVVTDSDRQIAAGNQKYNTRVGLPIDSGTFDQVLDENVSEMEDTHVSF